MAETQPNYGPRHIKSRMSLYPRTFYLLVRVKDGQTTAAVVQLTHEPFEAEDGWRVMARREEGTRRESISLADYGVTQNAARGWADQAAMFCLTIREFPAAGTDPLTLLTDDERRYFA